MDEEKKPKDPWRMLKLSLGVGEPETFEEAKEGTIFSSINNLAHERIPAPDSERREEWDRAQAQKRREEGDPEKRPPAKFTKTIYRKK